MFDIGWSELVVIGVVALIAIGPKELPGVLRSVGFWMGKVRRMASEFQGQFQEAMREAEMADLKKHADDLNTAAKQLTSGFENYDPLKDTGPAKTSTDNASSEPAASEAKPETAPPDHGQVAAMPETPVAEPKASEPVTTPVEAPSPEPVRREA